MKTTAITFFVAAALAADVFAQNPTQKDARAELSAAIAVEEQQGDLAAAERLYRELLNGNALSVPARALANQRLGSLLQRLGRADDAKPFLEAAQRASNIEITPAMPQDRARDAELGEQAKKLLADRSKEIDGETSKSLLWIGRPAAPAILAELEQALSSPNQEASERNQILAGMLWRIGGEQAEAFLRSVAARKDAPLWMVVRAFWLESDGMLSVAEAFLAHPDFKLVETMLHSGAAEGLAHRLPADAILTMAERGGDEHRGYALYWCAQRKLTTSESTRLAAIAAAAARSTNPSLGTSASVAIPHLQGSVAGLRLVFDQLPGQKRALAIVEPPEDVYVAGSKKFEPQIAADLWQRAMRSASALTERHDAWTWLDTWIDRLADARLPGQFEDLLALQKRRSEAWKTIARIVDAEHAVAAIQQVPDLNSEQGRWLLQGITRLDLPEEAGALLLSNTAHYRSELLANRDRAYWFCMALASTGHPDAMPLLRETVKSLNFDVRILTFAIHRSRSDAALAMAHEVFAELKKQRVQGAPQLLLALIAVGDEWALAQIDGSEQPQPHPYLDGPDGRLRAQAFGERQAPMQGEKNQTPLQYLLTTAPQPPHPFTLAQIEPVLKRVFADEQRHIAKSLVGSLPDASDDVVRLLARYDGSALNTGGGTYESWKKIAMQRMREQGGKNGWAEWLENSFADERQRYYVLNELTKDEVLARLAQIEGFVTAGLSVKAALDALLRAERTVDVVALLTSDNDDAKDWAFDRVCKGEATAPAATMLPFLAAKSHHTRMKAVQHFDRTLEAEAVPGMLALLRDPDGKIREAASAALQRIRFAHEQELLWARGQNGIDARPEAALEKLLAQAKPTEPKPKRLLAIASLGALGKPEALPFLIEWTEDQDAEIANAARAAAVQIHLASKR